MGHMNQQDVEAAGAADPRWVHTGAVRVRCAQLADTLRPAHARSVAQALRAPSNTKGHRSSNTPGAAGEGNKEEADQPQAGAADEHACTWGRQLGPLGGPAPCSTSAVPLPPPNPNQPLVAPLRTAEPGHDKRHHEPGIIGHHIGHPVRERHGSLAAGSWRGPLGHCTRGRSGAACQAG